MVIIFWKWYCNHIMYANGGIFWRLIRSKKRETKRRKRGMFFEYLIERERERARRKVAKKQKTTVHIRTLQHTLACIGIWGFWGHWEQKAKFYGCLKSFIFDYFLFFIHLVVLIHSLILSCLDGGHSHVIWNWTSDKGEKIDTLHTHSMRSQNRGWTDKAPEDTLPGA